MLNKWGALLLLFYAVMIFALWKLYKSVKDGATHIGEAAVGAVKGAADTLIVQPIQGGTVALAGVVGLNEAGGFKASDGQNDPTLQYNLARVAYARSKGYTPGTDEWLNPPGFPDKATWLDNGGAVTVVNASSIFN